MRSKYLSAFAALCFSSLSSIQASALTWGVNGHEIWGGPVWGDPETQFATMKRYGLTTYRFDVPLVDDHPEAAQTVQTLITLAAKYNITLHPIIYLPFNWNDNITDRGRYAGTEAGLEQQGYNRVYPFVKQFASQIHDWELDNEISLKDGVKNGMGYSPADYETAKAHQWAAAMRGMSNAIKTVQRETGQQLNTIVDTMYVDFGLIGFLQNNGVTVDKVAYHYYYEVGHTPYQIWAPNGQSYDVFAELQKLGKPILINEFNAAEIYAPVNSPPKPYNDTQALQSLQKHINFIRSQTEANIEGVEYYELYNDSNPALNAAESNFGLMTDASHPRTQLLLTAAYDCGALSAAEQSNLIAHGLFTSSTLASQVASCQTAATTAAPPAPSQPSTTTTTGSTTSTSPTEPTISNPYYHPHAHHKHYYPAQNNG